MSPIVRGSNPRDPTRIPLGPIATFSEELHTIYVSDIVESGFN